MKLSIVVPCYNEKKTIYAVIQAIKAAPFDDKEIIIVDDCSNDGTREILRRDIEPLVARVLYHDVNCGKGAALRTGIKTVTGDIVITPGCRSRIRPKGVFCAYRSDCQQPGGCGLWIAFHGRASAPRALFLAQFR